MLSSEKLCQPHGTHAKTCLKSRCQLNTSHHKRAGSLKKHTQKSYTINKYHDKLTSDTEAARLADVEWLGDSLDILRGFPSDVQGDLGYALEQVQRGQMPADSKAHAH